MSQIVSSGPSFSKILLGLDGSDYTQSATQYACQIASKHQAEITGMAIIDIPGEECRAGTCRQFRRK